MLVRHWVSILLVQIISFPPTKMKQNAIANLLSVERIEVIKTETPTPRTPLSKLKFVGFD